MSTVPIITVLFTITKAIGDEQNVSIICLVRLLKLIDDSIFVPVEFLPQLLNYHPIFYHRWRKLGSHICPFVSFFSSDVRPWPWPCLPRPCLTT